MEKGKFSWKVKATSSRRGPGAPSEYGAGAEYQRRLEQRVRDLFSLLREEQEMGRMERAAITQRLAEAEHREAELYRRIDELTVEVEELRSREDAKVCSYCAQRGLG